jgi:AP-2 complex subunit alpha
MGESLSTDVHRLLISPTSKAVVKKKAALTLLRLYRKHPAIVQHEWAERIVALMDDPDMGVTLSVTSLVMALAHDDLEQYKSSYNKAANRLKRIILEHEYTPDYLYYKVPCPWLQVKLLRLLQYYPPSEDTHIREILRDCLRKIMDSASEMPKNVQQNNAQNAVLFEAINLTIHLETETTLMVHISSRLGKFIQSRETNVKYLGLEAMTHLAARSETLDPIKKHQAVIIGSLKDRDISVRRKGLDLLYSMCDPSNAQPIVAELLRYLLSADYAIREEMVLKIAILTEKYATDSQWYVDISLRLIATAGDHVSDEVWQRVIQIVTNNEDLQVYAAKNILSYLKADHCHETLVKIGGYLLGEFGHLVADNEGCSPIEQFMALQPKLHTTSPSTRAIIMSALIKYVNLFPEIKPQLLQVFQSYSSTLDPEIQQRACEYLALASLPTDDLLRTVCDEMPPFPERESALLSRLHQKHAGSSERRTWLIGGKDANADQKELKLANNGLKRSFTTNGFSSNGGTNGKLNGNASNSRDDLAGLDLTLTRSQSEPTKAPNFASAAHLSPGWETGYNLLLQKVEGILYEDPQIQVGVRSEYREQMGCLILYYSNKSSAPIYSFTITPDNPSPETVRIDLKSTPETTLEPGSQTQQMIMVEAKHVFDRSPTLRITYLAGALQAVTLKLPVAIHKYMTPTDLGAEDFFKRWKQIGTGEREAQKIFGVHKNASRIIPSRVKEVLKDFKWGVLDGVDPNQRNFVGASVLATGEGGKFGCLMRLEPNYDTKVCAKSSPPFLNFNGSIHASPTQTANNCVSGK